MSSSKFPPDVIKHWPEVFKHVDVHTVPIEYVTSIHIYFRNGKEWVVDFDSSKANSKLDRISNELDSLFEEYGEEIANIDFSIDTVQVKRDIQRKTRQFIKGKNKKDGSRGK